MDRIEQAFEDAIEWAINHRRGLGIVCIIGGTAIAIAAFLSPAGPLRYLGSGAAVIVAALGAILLALRESTGPPKD